MNDANTMKKCTYFFDCLYWSFVSMLLYKTCFRCFFPSYRLSMILLGSLILLLIPTGIATTWKHRRNHLSAFVSVLFPFEIYTLLTYKEELRIICLICLFSFLFLSIGYCLKVYQSDAYPPKTFNHCFLEAHTIFVLCFSVLLLIPVTQGVLGISLVNKTTAPVSAPISMEEVTIQKNINVLQNLKEEHWSTLSTTEKLSVLQTVANVETWYLGLPCELRVIASSLGNNTLGAYIPSIYTIEVNIDLLTTGTAEECLNTVAHEAFHAYEHAQVEMYKSIYESIPEDYERLLLFDTISQYDQEFQNYQSGSSDFIEYINYLSQRSEYDARVYAEEAVEEYLYKINRYTKGVE